MISQLAKQTLRRSLTCADSVGEAAHVIQSGEFALPSAKRSLTRDTIGLLPFPRSAAALEFYDFIFSFSLPRRWDNWSFPPGFADLSAPGHRRYGRLAVGYFDSLGGILSPILATCSGRKRDVYLQLLMMAPRQKKRGWGLLPGLCPAWRRGPRSHSSSLRMDRSAKQGVAGEIPVRGSFLSRAHFRPNRIGFACGTPDGGG